MTGEFVHRKKRALLSRIYCILPAVLFAALINISSCALTPDKTYEKTTLISNVSVFIVEKAYLLTNVPVGYTDTLYYDYDQSQYEPFMVTAKYGSYPSNQNLTNYWIQRDVIDNGDLLFFYVPIEAPQMSNSLFTVKMYFVVNTNQ